MPSFAVALFSELIFSKLCWPTFLSQEIHRPAGVRFYNAFVGFYLTQCRTANSCENRVSFTVIAVEKVSLGLLIKFYLQVGTAGISKVCKHASRLRERRAILQVDPGWVSRNFVSSSGQVDREGKKPRPGSERGVSGRWLICGDRSAFRPRRKGSGQDLLPLCGPILPSARLNTVSVCDGKRGDADALIPTLLWHRPWLWSDPDHDLDPDPYFDTDPDLDPTLTRPWPWPNPDSTPTRPWPDLDPSLTWPWTWPRSLPWHWPWPRPWPRTWPRPRPALLQTFAFVSHSPLQFHLTFNSYRYRAQMVGNQYLKVQSGGQFEFLWVYTCKSLQDVNARSTTVTVILSMQTWYSRKVPWTN